MKEKIKEKDLLPKFRTDDITPFLFNSKEISLKDISEVPEPGENKLQKAKINIKFSTTKMPYFRIESTPKPNKKRTSKNLLFNDGRWKKDEHNHFLQGIALYGNNWKKVKSLVKTRSAIQVRSHAQKFFNKIKLFKDDNLGIDFTLDSINNYNDMIKQIKSINPQYDILNIFKKLSYNHKEKKEFNTINKNYLNNNIFEKDKSPLLNEVQKELISQNKENNILINNLLITNQNNQNKINENNNNLNNIITQNNNINIAPNNLYVINNYINDNNFINVLNKDLFLDVNNNFKLDDILNYSNLFNIDLYNEILSMNRKNMSLINSLNQINNILFSSGMQLLNPICHNEDNNLDKRFKELYFPNQFPSLNIDTNYPNNNTFFK